MRIPTRLTFSGDKDKAKEHIGRARKEVGVLEHLMSFQGLKQGARTVRPYPGVVIECWSCFDLRQVNVYVEPTGGAQVTEPTKECFCTSCFAMGRIVDFTLGTGNAATEVVCTTYDVEVCYKDRYVLFESVTAVDAGIYELGQLVIVTESITNTDVSCCPGGVCRSYEIPVIIPICLTIDGVYSMWRWHYGSN